MQIDITPGDVTVAAISGSVDSLTAEQLMQTLGKAVSDNQVRLVADFSAVVYTSSAGLRALLATLKDARRQGGDFRLAGVQPAVLRVLELSGFTSILKLYGDVGSAVASFDAELQ
ncbi:STAS domain-containing protein [Variovorax saccharolyticus]|uniref:STAS domain-containing protein n=1 Tax=Variovorax saccharolyticus TaxID=3053516 RepID=UPI002577B250|nr:MULTISPECIES: STAS domain-containing protein [unclassified Variovorax]MDM0021478.1 STAS domain-containing protein [Variovorax sp. J22R187]MDM0027484.1 STAS domain-containing protein [Variovorax sp. J31P216]